MSQADLLDLLPPEPPNAAQLREEIGNDVVNNNRKFVVLDDDPTGTQTVHGVDVLTTWEESDLLSALRLTGSLFFVLTNSRGLSEQNALHVANTLTERLHRIRQSTGVRLDVISRSDSTLRGHYPAELLPLATLAEFDGHLLVPAFPEGGRITVSGVHYVGQSGGYVPVAQTVFARDPSFAFYSSHLAEWTVEKSRGRWKLDDVLHVSIDHIRLGGPNEVRDVLLKARNNQPIVCDAVTDTDLTVLVAGLVRAEARGGRYLARTAASFVRIRGNISPRGYASQERLVQNTSRGGLVLVGSYVDLTALQLTAALAMDGVEGRELSVSGMLDEDNPSETAVRLAKWAESVIEAGRTAVIFTSRELIPEHSGRSHVEIASIVSSAMAAIPRLLEQAPAWIVTKGGVTSSEVVTRGLGARKATVRGQIAAGISIWTLDKGSYFPDTPIVVFPGNVGQPEALANIIEKLVRT